MLTRLCPRCGKEVPRFAEVGGKRRNLQHRKHCLECSPFGEHNTRQLAPLTTKILCLWHLCPNAISGGRFCSFGCKNKYHVQKRRDDLKAMAVAYKGGCCAECGYSKCMGSLTFHHREPEAKEFNLTATHTRSWTRIKVELDKCVLLCANCHGEVHAKWRQEQVALRLAARNLRT